MRMLTKQKISTVVSSILVLSLWTGVTVGVAHAKLNTASANHLLAKLQSQETIRVIVTERDQSHNPQITSRYSVIDPEPGLVARYKKPKKLKLVRQFKHLPQSVYEVNAVGLQALLDDPNVSVHENRIARPSLAQSVKRVYPSQEFSPYHGNNDWAVAVIDSGVNSSHPMLAGKVVSEACYSTTDTSAPDVDLHSFSLCPGGVNSSTNAGSGQDCDIAIDGCGHGTSMAGIAVGNSGGKLGVAKDGNIISIKVMREANDPFNDICDSPSCAVALETDLLAGIDRVIELSSTYKIAAVNFSLNFNLLPNNGAGDCDEDSFKLAIDRLLVAGIPIVVPVGNDGRGDSLRSPGCISTSFSVGASLDSSDSLWPDTNRSRNMDIFAPGANITTAKGGGYATVSGTSASAAHVSGAWVAARHAWPTATIVQLEDLIRSKGPIIFSASGQSKRRLDLTSILDTIDPGSQKNPNPLPLAGVYLILLDEE